MLKATSKAKKQDLGLTVTRATRDARKVVDTVMPGAYATVESRIGYDLAGDVATMITTITFPDGHPRTEDLYAATIRIPGQIDTVRTESARIVITRKR